MSEASPRKAIVRKLLWDLMTNLIYPAVLGTVLYIALDVAARVIPPIFSAAWRLRRLPFDARLAAKIALLSVTLLFYCCDYLYLRFTMRFKIRFFIYDLFFLINLYLAVVFMHLGEHDTEAPRSLFISLSFLLFMFFYLWWDLEEIGDLRKGRALLAARAADTRFEECTEQPLERALARLSAEITLYRQVVLWEYSSIALLLFTSVILWRQRGDEAFVWLLAGTLAIITGVFGWLIWEKAKLHQPYQTA